MTSPVLWVSDSPIFTTYPFLTNSPSFSNFPYSIQSKLLERITYTLSLHFLSFIRSTIHCNLASVPSSFASLLIRVTSHLIIMKPNHHVSVSVTFYNRLTHLHSSVKGPCHATTWLFLESFPISIISLSLVLFQSLIFGLSYPCQPLNSVPFNTGWLLESSGQYLKNANTWDPLPEILIQRVWEGTQAAPQMMIVCTCGIKKPTALTHDSQLCLFREIT